MALIGLLIAAALILLYIVMSGTVFNTENKINEKSIESKATQAVEKTLENAKVEQNQANDIDLQK